MRLFYSVRTASEAIGLDILNNAAVCFPFFSFELVVTQRDGRLDASRIVASAPFDPNDADFFFCGPVNLRHAILKGLESLDITPRRIRFELFEFR